MKESIKQSIKETNLHFSIVGLYVDGECDTHLRKNVEPGHYFFNEWCELKGGKVSLIEIRRPEENFFASNIFLYNGIQ